MGLLLFCLTITGCSGCSNDAEENKADNGKPEETTKKDKTPEEQVSVPNEVTPSATKPEWTPEQIAEAVAALRTFKVEVVLDGAGNVTKVDATGKNLQDGHLSFVEGLAYLKVLKLTENKQITDKGLQYLKWLDQLKVLDLDRTSVSDGGIDIIKSLKTLEEVILLDTQVTEAGGEQLKQAMPDAVITDGY